MTIRQQLINMALEFRKINNNLRYGKSLPSMEYIVGIMKDYKKPLQYTPNDEIAFLVLANEFLELIILISKEDKHEELMLELKKAMDILK